MLSYRQENPRPRNTTRPGDITVPSLKSVVPPLSNAHPTLGLGSPALDEVCIEFDGDCGDSFASGLNVSAIGLHSDSIGLEPRGSLDTELSSPTGRRELNRQRPTKDYADSDSQQD